jgi:phage terminase large subunit-like protein
VQRMSATPPPDLSGLDGYQHWKPEAQEQALALLQEYEQRGWKPFFCPNPKCDGKPHGTDWNFNHARVDQRPPPWNGDWLTWLISSGRGAGKTYTGSNVINRASKRVRYIGLLGATGPDLRETMIEGESGILATAKPGERPEWNPSRKRLVWPNGCVAQGFSGEEPDRIRGKNTGLWWVDEPAHIDLIDACWKQIKLTLRAPGDRPHIIATTTPKPSKWMKKLVADPKTITVRASTYVNLDNLNPAFAEMILEDFEGTRFGRQELHGEVLPDVEGSLWKAEMFVQISEDKVPDLERIVVGVDPAGSANPKSDETGIVVLGLADRRVYVLADYTGKYSPSGWARRALDAAEEFGADAIVAEKNYGGDMVRNTIEKEADDYALPPRVLPVNSRRGKQLRAEPIVAMYEKGRVVHVTGQHRNGLLELEGEQVEWVPGEGPSPNRIDALVHAATEVAAGFLPASLADPTSLLRGRRAASNRHLHAV